jgi:hypothetical protein
MESAQVNSSSRQPLGSPPAALRPTIRRVCRSIASQVKRDQSPTALVSAMIRPSGSRPIRVTPPLGEVTCRVLPLAS